jgi:hypothetical protein
VPALGVGQLEERVRRRAAGVGEPDLARGRDEARQELQQHGDVAALVEDVGGEHEGERAAGQELLRGRPVRRHRLQRHVVALRVVVQQLQRGPRPVRGQDPAAGARRDDARQTEAAAQLHDARPAQRPAVERTGQRDAAGPELGPVREELVLLRERPLVDERLGVARAQDLEVVTAQRDRLLHEIVHDAPSLRPDRTVGHRDGS